MQGSRNSYRNEYRGSYNRGRTNNTHGNYQRNYRDDYREEYVDGSAARQLKPVRRERELTPVRRRSAADRDANLKTVKRIHLSIPFVTFICIFVIGLGLAVTNYIKLSSDVIAYREQCSSLEEQYEDLKTSNDLYEQRINNSVDLAEIQRIAVCELGMKLAGEGQIVEYSGEIEDYVKQYSDIPQ